MLSIGPHHIWASLVDCKPALEKALAAVGGPSALSKAFADRGVTITSQAISQWTKVPPARVIDVEAICGVPRHELRPDMYPAPIEVSR